MYNFTSVINNVIKECELQKRTISVKGKDTSNNVLWIVAEYVKHPDKMAMIVKLNLCNPDTGATLYSTYIKETMKPLV